MALVVYKIQSLLLTMIRQSAFMNHGQVGLLAVLALFFNLLTIGHGSGPPKKLLILILEYSICTTN